NFLYVPSGVLPVGKPSVKYRSGPGANLLIRLRMYFAAHSATWALLSWMISFMMIIRWLKREREREREQKSERILENVDFIPRGEEEQNAHRGRVALKKSRAALVRRKKSAVWRSFVHQANLIN